MPILHPDPPDSLRRMRLLATTCVAAAFILRILLAFFPDTLLLGYLRAMTEAAVVGGLADWFAVTALFHHPLGLPIPHTRILPRNKDRIAKSLSNFVVANFLCRQVIEREFAAIDLTANAANYLEARAELIATRITEYLPRILGALDDQDISRLIHEQLTSRLHAVPLSRLTGSFIELLTSGDKHERIVDDLLKVGETALNENRDVLISLIRREIPIPDSFQLPKLSIPVPLGLVKDKLAELIAQETMKRVLRTIGEVRADRDHEIRARIRVRIARLAIDLKESPRLRARGEEIKEEFLSNPNVTTYAAQIWAEIKAAILADALRPDSQIREQIANTLRRASEQVKSDGQLRDKLNAGFRSAAVEIICENSPQVTRMIQETVSRWDGAELASKLELEVGRDLQFVRLNGTLVGGLLGALLHLITTLL